MNSFKEKMKFFVWGGVHQQPKLLIRFWQKKRFKDIAEYAYRHIPMYRELWDRAGIREYSNIDNIASLPSINKRTFQERDKDDFMHGYSPKFSFQESQTSGSTGEPFRFISPLYGSGSREEELRYILFKRWRFFVWDGRDFNDVIANTRCVKCGERPRWYDLPNSLPLNMERLYSDFEGALNELREYGAELIVGYPSKLAELCSVLHHHGKVGAVTFKYCSTTGELLTEAQRAFIQDTLGCEIYNRYGSEELKIFGLECREHDGYHINSESFILEIVDEEGKPVPTGQYGRIVATSFYGRVMPFIRYDTGDYGKLLEGDCPCGLETPRIIVEGRRLSLPFGAKELSYIDININLAKYAGVILQWQIRKKSERSLEMIIVCSPLFTKDILVPLERRFKKLLGDDIEVIFTLRDATDRIAERKCRLFVDETSDIPSPTEAFG